MSEICGSWESLNSKGWRLGARTRGSCILASVMPTHIHITLSVLCQEHKEVISTREPDRVCV
ncbi:uncharacterized protein LACBIDRAFT_296567 [Laccaria bicolor S238N-H82]|uniref:Predicted protein n=1 Tax=Laccaria bicolor (strain S238N-H82 / ATCC MYA-4686) TaxID=486041 RepID=B0D947_LACBS|nr:uncharacterized protein LACBIDRAFT_296567 [Laccaria bicolor S238N-H82]EDR09191.1 predicted protein [Laccaria bicolor S238N-H82]|eukprot:XP_001880504.1 predicted protein [Laccaria bicolor S238N-H82]